MADYADIGQLANVGQMQEGYQQAALEDDIARFNFEQNLPHNKLNQFLTKKCIERNIDIVTLHIDKVNLNSKGDIESLTSSQDISLKGDFFIDCSGFARVLMKKLNVGWKSYSDYLPCNTAMPFVIKNENIKNPWTTATAMSSGWMWDIPLQTRNGCGYVYNNNFITDDQAKDEIEQLLHTEIEPIKIINFDPGRADKFWEKNVLSLGLASCFVEPLQATSIHTTVAQILLFVNDFLDQDANITISEVNQESYNRRTAHFYDLNLDFVSMHYQSNSIDTLFWNHIKDNNIVSPFAKHIIERSKNKLVSYFEIANNFGAPAIGLWNWSMAGLNMLNDASVYTDLLQSNTYELAESQFIKHMTTIQN
jgi:tryptophan halogenase